MIEWTVTTGIAQYVLTVAQMNDGRWTVGIVEWTGDSGMVPWEGLTDDTFAHPLDAIEYGVGSIYSYEE